MAHNPPDAPLFEYRVKPSCRHGKDRRYGPGDIVMLTEFEAEGFSDKLELVGPVPFTETESEEVALSEAIDATPAAVELAAELGVDLSNVSGSGAGGRILVKDIEAALDEE